MTMEEIIRDFEDLKSWINQNGGYVNDKLSLVPTANSKLSIVCNTNLDNEKLIIVNKKLVISPENSELVLEELLDYKNKLVLCLLYELKKPETKFNSYFKLLPNFDQYYNHPIFLFSQGRFPRFSEKIYIRAQELYQKIINLSNYIQNIDNSFFRSITKDELIWAYLTVLTRSIDGVGLVPIIDFFQHSNGSSTPIEQGQDHFQISLRGQYSIGEIVYINHQFSDDIDFFLHKGVVDKTEICNVKSDFQFKQKSDFLKMIIDNISLEPYSHLSSIGISNNLMYYLRVQMLSESDLIFMDKSPNFYNGIITLENERSCLQKIKIKLNHLNTKEEIDFVNVNLSNYKDDSLEHNMCLLIQKIDRMSVVLNTMIDDYWKSLLQISN